MPSQIKHPETGEVHILDKEALTELTEAIDRAERNDLDECVFRAMRIEIYQAEKILSIASKELAGEKV